LKLQRLPALSCNLPGCSGSFNKCGLLLPAPFGTTHNVYYVKYEIWTVSDRSNVVPPSKSEPHSQNAPSGPDPFHRNACSHPVGSWYRSIPLYCPFPRLCRPFAAGNHRFPCWSPRWHRFADSGHCSEITSFRPLPPQRAPRGLVRLAQSFWSRRRRDNGQQVKRNALNCLLQSCLQELDKSLKQNAIQYFPARSSRLCTYSSRSASPRA